MMDLQMSSSTPGNSTSFPTWDFNITDGIVPLISGDVERVQTAAIAAFIQVGSVPQLPEVGVPWAESLTGGATFGDIDAAIRKAALNSGVSDFSPDYDFENGRLTVTMTATQGAS
jgi:hypothetical protein